MADTGGTEPVRVQVASPDRQLRPVVLTAFGGSEWEAAQTTEITTTVAMATATPPRVIVLDARNEDECQEIVQELRADFRAMLIPFVFVADGPPKAGLTGLVGQSDDYVVWPVQADELVSRVRMTLARSAASRTRSPLTGLPGNVVISQELERRLSEGASFALLHADIDGFKQYNDRYGFSRGDSLIAFLAGVVVGALEAKAGGPCFAGHVGGDDFVVMVPPEGAEAVARTIVSVFDEGVGDAYDRDDLERGWVEVTDRRGEVVKAPICTVSIGVAYSARGFDSPAQMAEAAAEVKGVAKRREGSAWASDRRRS
jgi:diguanylate cyclase (GGDEF)-like protein